MIKEKNLQKKRDKQDKDTLNMDQAIELLKTSRPTFYRWLREGKLEGMKVGRQWRFYKEDIERFMRGDSKRVELPSDITPLINYLKNKVEEISKTFKLDDKKNPVEQAFELIVCLGVTIRTSDIHLEIFQDEGILRYRVDGVLHEVAKISKNLMPFIVDQWKREAKCNLQKKDIPQDGRIIFQEGKKKIVIFVHIQPTVFGESVIGMFIDESIIEISLEALPFKDKQLEIFKKHLNNPFGLILCTGPTGSGKTTTLYAALNYVNKPGRKLLSVEDPVEYYRKGVSQVAVSEDNGLTFPKIIKSFIRCQPDVIMVGEIRDPETAYLCHTVAITGHLVLSQLHTNNSASALIRLIDVGIPPYLVGDAVHLVVAQRLVRMVCSHCAQDTKLSSEQIEKAKYRVTDGGISWNSFPKKWVKAVGCPKCRQLGYKGRTCINEMLEMSSEIRTALIRGTTENEIRSISLSQGMTKLPAEAIRLAANGLTTIEEALGIT